MFDSNQHLHILEASGRLNLFISAIKQAAKWAEDEVNTELPTLPPCDIIVVDDSSGAIPELGVGGWAKESHILISINPEFPNLYKTLEMKLRRVFAHELHHVTRMNGEGQGITLLEAMVLEGLADHFDIQVTQCGPSLWDVALTDKEKRVMGQRALREYNNVNYVHSDWFFGSRNIPRWTGYTLGFEIVESHLKRTKQTASELVNAPAGEFIG